MNSSQLGRAGELALSLYALVTSGGSVELFSPLVDDDHVDLVGGLRGGLPAIGLQVKATDSLDRTGLVEARASYPANAIREDPAFLYAVVWLQSTRIAALWVVPSPDFNRLVYRSSADGRDVLEFRGSPSGADKFSGFLVDPLRVGPVLASTIGGLTSVPDWLPALGRRTVR